MLSNSYNQFCPVAMASEILGSRWTIVLLRELCAGSTRFNELRKGVPRMSPALLSKRLKELEAQGVLVRRPVAGQPDTHEYILTPAGEELKEVVMAIGVWGQRWVQSEPSLQNLDAGLLMWDMRRNLDIDHLPDRRVVVQFNFTDNPLSGAVWWLIHDPVAGADLCSVDPGFDVDLYAHSDLKTMTAIWMGLERLQSAVDRNALLLVGDQPVARAMQNWLKLSPFAPEEKQVS